jgi:hypothetical protein
MGSLLLTAAEERDTPPDPPPQGADRFLQAAWLRWAREFLRFVFTPRHAFPKPTRPPLVTLPDRCTLALASDWGTGTVSAYKVRYEIGRARPDYTIHLGDVYYSGTAAEFTRYVLGPEDWPAGARGTFFLNGNHEMYSGGAAYFTLALPAVHQPASYFALETGHWRFVALDTGYFAKQSALGFVWSKLTRRDPIVLHDDILVWLRDVVFADRADTRPVILLSHHQWYSAFEEGYHRVGAALRDYLPRVVLWFWGHEHKLAGYGRDGVNGLPPVRGRCIGHGGMPIELPGSGPWPVKHPHRVVFVDQRPAPDGVGGQRVGLCGYARLRLDGPTLDVCYVDEDGVELLTERWTRTATGARGEVVAWSPSLTVLPGRTIEELVT